MKGWEKIWNTEERIHNIVLETLIKADGFDTGIGAFSSDDWKEYVKSHYNNLNIGKTDTIYEVGCGSGAFMYPLHLNKNMVGGN